jgi:predicted DNA binding CopG/RHH family protein
MSEHHIKELPAFQSEAEEAQWWFDNREAHAEEFVQAIDEGRVTRGAMLKRGLVRTPTIQIDAQDLSQAIILAEKKGIFYQTYLQKLIHEALERELKLAS